MKEKEIKRKSIKSIENLFQKEKKRKEKKQKEFKERESRFAISKHSLLFYTPSAICLFDQVAT